MKLGDFYHLNVPGDGACFFHSIVAILEVEKSKNVTDYKFSSGKESLKMRQRVVSWLRNHLDYIVKGMGMSISGEINDTVQNEAHLSSVNGRAPKYTTIAEYLTFMSDESSYAGQIEIYAVSELLKRNIRVYTSKRNHPDEPLKNIGLGYVINTTSQGGQSVGPNINDISLYHNFGKKVGQGLHHFEPLLPKQITDSRPTALPKQGEATTKDEIKRKTASLSKTASAPKKTPKKTPKTASLPKTASAPKKAPKRSKRITTNDRRTPRRAPRVDRRTQRRASRRRAERSPRRTQRRTQRRAPPRGVERSRRIVDRRTMRKPQRVDRRRTQRQSVRRVDRRRTQRHSVRSKRVDRRSKRVDRSPRRSKRVDRQQGRRLRKN